MPTANRLGCQHRQSRPTERKILTHDHKSDRLLVQEMRAMAAAYGMNLDTMMEIIRSSSGASYMAENWDFFEPNWQHMGRMAKKDMDLCIAAAEARDVAVPLVKAAGELTGK